MISALLRKEMRLAASPLSYFFIAFATMALLPGYPVLCGADASCVSRIVRLV